MIKLCEFILDIHFSVHIWTAAEKIPLVHDPNNYIMLSPSVQVSGIFKFGCKKLFYSLISSIYTCIYFLTSKSLLAYWINQLFLFIQMQSDISTRYKDRIVNIMGEINTMWWNLDIVRMDVIPGISRLSRTLYQMKIFGSHCLHQSIKISNLSVISNLCTYMSYITIVDGHISSCYKIVKVL